MSTLDEHIAAARRRPGFVSRINRRVEQDETILNRLRDHSTPHPGRQAVDWPKPDDGLPPDAWLG